MKSAKEISQMHMLLQEGWSKRMVASQLGISRNTLERYLALGDVQSTSAARHTSKLDCCLEWLAEQREGCNDDNETLRRRLEEERTVKVSLRTMQRALKRLQEKKAQKNKKQVLQKAAEQDIDHPAEMVLETTGWRIGPYQLSASGELNLGGSRIHMAATQRQLLLMFAKRPNRLVEQQELAAKLWPEKSLDQHRSRMIRLSIHRLRQVFACGPLGGNVITSVYRKGYVFHAPVENMHPLVSKPDETETPELEEGQRKTYRGCVERMMGNPFYSEVHDHWPKRDPYKLHRQEALLQQSVQYDPLFEQGYLELCYTQLLECYWGMRSAQDVRSRLQQQLETIHQLHQRPAGWLGIKAEVQSLLLWQPLTTQRLYGTWLAATLPMGMPLFAWTRHLIFTGKPKTAVKLLKAQVSDDLCQGWLSLAIAYCAIGHFGAAEEAIERQLKIEPSMVGTRLFLALVIANRGQSELATKLVLETGLLERPFQGVQALVAYTLAQGSHNRRAHRLLDEALEKINEDPFRAGAIGYWGLAALELKRDTEAIQLLKLSIHHRCYSAPVLFSTPFMKAYANTTAYRLFAERMRKSFPIHI